MEVEITTYPTHETVNFIQSECFNKICGQFTFGRIRFSGVNVNTERLFSFSLTALDMKTLLSDNIKLKQWLEKYMYKQIDEFVKLFQNPNWRDFNVIHFVDQEIIQSSILWPLFYNRLSTILNNYSDRYILYSYNDNSLKGYKYIGTMIRYFPLIMENVNVVLFRDAHSTMPNSKYNFDRTWYELWNNWDNRNKRFWLYQSITYRPLHSEGIKVPFAAAWGARRTSGTRTILTVEQFNDLFDVNKTFNGVREDGRYGIDERLFYLFIESYRNQGRTFIDESYIIGIVWIYYLFNSQMDTSEYQIVKQNGKTYAIRELTSNLYTTYSYLAEDRCILYYILKRYANGLDTKIAKAWDIIDELSNPSTSLTQMDQAFTDMVRLIPQKQFLWEFLFNSPFDVDKSTILDELKSYSAIDSKQPPLDYQNMCNIIPKYFTGGLLNYDKYTNGNNHINLPPNIKM